MSTSRDRDDTSGTQPLRTCRAADGVRLAYLCRPGPEGNTPVALLHGLASNHSRWLELLDDCPALAERTVLCPDLRGHGASERHGRLGHDRWTQDLLDVLDHEGIQRAVIGGHCLGANLALHFAAQHPERCAALFLIEPMPPEAIQGRLGQLASVSWLLRPLISLLRGLNRMGLKRRQFRHVDLRALDQQARERMRTEGAEAVASSHGAPLKDLHTMPVASYLASLLSVVSPLPDPQQIGAPTLALLASGTHMTDLIQVHQYLDALPNQRTIEVDAVHWIPTERPDALAQALAEFLSSHQPA